jgi:Protein of unknown function (DUF2946).
MLVWAVLQFALPSAAAYADALLERSSLHVLGGHVEEHGTKSCVQAHPADCAICQIVNRVGPMPLAIVPVGIVVRIATPYASPTVAAALSSRGRAALPRAPPLG